MRALVVSLLWAFLADPAAALDEAAVPAEIVARLTAPAGCTPGRDAAGWERRALEIPRDGYRLRYSRFGCDLGAKGALVLLPGRGEFSPEFFETAIDFIARGYGPVYVVDHRGQGLSPRLLEDPHKGHIARFEDYVDDMAVFVGAVKDDLAELGAGPAPRLFLTSNSMGGAIAIGYLQQRGADVPFTAAALIGAMLRVNYISYTGKPSSWLNLRIYSEGGALAQALWRCDIATLWDRDRCAQYAVQGSFAGYRPGSRQFRPDDEAKMTQSAARYDLRTYMLDTFDWSDIAAREYTPEENWTGPQIGGATNGWVQEAARFNRQMRRPAAVAGLVHVPLMLITGTRDLRTYREYADWRGKAPDLSHHVDFCDRVNAASLAARGTYICDFLAINGGFHELYEERDLERRQTLDAVDWFFQTHSAAGAP